jgi:hypothetical protein
MSRSFRRLRYSRWVLAFISAVLITCGITYHGALALARAAPLPEVTSGVGFTSSGTVSSSTTSLVGMKSSLLSTTALKVPVILIHGVGGNPWVTWGFPVFQQRNMDFGGKDDIKRASGLTRFLMSKGYVLGKSLFAVDWGDSTGFDYVRDYKALIAAIDRAKKISSSNKVDIVCSDTAALTCRYYLGSAEYQQRKDVRTLIMIGPANRGLFLANVLKSGQVLVRQREVDSGRRSISRVVPGDLEWPGSEAGKEGSWVGERGHESSSANRSLPAYNSGAFNGMEYVLKRSAESYERLYLEYLVSNEILGDPTGAGIQWVAGSKTRSFEAWLAGQRPEIFRTCMLENQEPPAGRGIGEKLTLPTRAPLDGQVLTGAYYENLAMMAGKAACIKRMNDSQSLMDRLFEYPYLSMDYKEILVHYGAIVGRYLLEKIWGETTRAGGSFMLNQFEKALNIKEPTAIDRLIEEELLYPIGIDSGGKEKVVPLRANHFLEQINALDFTRRVNTRTESAIRYVVIAGKTMNLLSWIWPRLEENDSFVALKSTYLPLSVRDSFRLFAGVPYGSHHGLTYNSNVWEYVFRNLNADKAAKMCRITPATPIGTGEVRASLWEPCYVDLQFDEFYSQGYLNIDIRHISSSDGAFGLPGAGNGLLSAGTRSKQAVKIKAWLEADGAILKEVEVPLSQPETAGTGPLQGPGASSPASITIGIPAGGESGKLRLGVRLVSDAVSSDTFEQYLTLPLENVGFSVAMDGKDRSYIGSGAMTESGDSLGGETGSYFETLPGDSCLGGPSVPGEDGAQAKNGNGRDDAGDYEQENLPVIVAKYRNKRTTTVPERIFRHERWEWDFGNGEKMVDSSGHSETSRVRRRFDEHGVWEVSATSISADGRTLRKARWTVIATDEEANESVVQDEGGFVSRTPGEIMIPVGEVCEFEAVTVKPPEVTLRIVGPVEWVTGRPARFDVEFDIDEPEFCIEQSVTRIYPGKSFLVVWERPSRYEVEVAVTVKTTYVFDDQRLTLYNTYCGRTSVNVLASGISD